MPDVGRRSGDLGLTYLADWIVRVGLRPTWGTESLWDLPTAFFHARSRKVPTGQGDLLRSVARRRRVQSTWLARSALSHHYILLLGHTDSGFYGNTSLSFFGF